VSCPGGSETADDTGDLERELEAATAETLATWRRQWEAERPRRPRIVDEPCPTREQLAMQAQERDR
jgi:hypothetical protein